MEGNSCDEVTATVSLVDNFYGGAEAFHDGKAEADMPIGLSNDEKRYWLTGFRSAVHRAMNPCISVDEYDKVSAAAYRAGSEDRANGTSRTNPFSPECNSERNDIWATVYSDAIGNSGFEDFEVLGTPMEIIDVQ